MDVQRMLNQKAWNGGNLDEFSKFSANVQKLLEKAIENRNIVRLLKSLHFKQIKERHSDIRDAHRKTLEWIFDPSSGVDFPRWLSSSGNTDDIYWVTGKAGSGKSTLMKFIQSHPKTRQLLLRGSPSQVIIATHYFWCAGTSIQKSQIGLFRTLLFQILTQCPELIPSIAPTRFEDKQFASLESWSRGELLETFERLAAFQPKDNLRICIFVDGLDEYNGDHRELANIFCLLSRSRHLKLCLSSRPWQDFIDAFGASKWKLQLQDLTKNDIRLYIKDNLEQDARFRELRRRDQQGADNLAQQIQSKAQGVFLWVYLVVRSLIRGLINSDRIEDLHRRLNELPTELEKYFELMLDNIEPTYRRQTARVFRVMLNSQFTLPIIAFHFVNEESANENSESLASIHSWSPEEIERVLDQQKRQLNASCKDLLHITVNPGESGFLAAKVGFLHRTVMDFLRTGSMEDLLNSRSGPSFDPNLSLCRTYWSMYRAFILGKLGERTPDGVYLLGGTLHYARETERQSGCLATTVLNDLDATLSHSAWKLHANDEHCRSLLDFAVRFDLQVFVSKQMCWLQLNSDRRGIASLLRQSLRAEFSVEGDDAFYITTTRRIGFPMLQYLLENKANPNETLVDGTELDSIDVQTDGSESGRGRFARTHRFECYGVDRSVWADFLFELEDVCPTLYDGDHLVVVDNSPTNRGLLKNSYYEACELLISYGARRNYLKTNGVFPEYTTPYLQADDVFSRVFPKQASHLARLLDQKEFKVEEDKKSRCTVM